GLGYRGTVVHAAAGKTLGARNVEHAVSDTGSDQQRPATDLASVGQPHEPVRVIAAEPDSLCRREYLGAEAPRLRRCPTAEFAATDARREAEIVLDARTHACLATG